MKKVVEDFINSKWDDECVPLLEEYIRIPCQSPAYDKDWETNGLLDQAPPAAHCLFPGLMATPEPSEGASDAVRRVQRNSWVLISV